MRRPSAPRLSDAAHELVFDRGRVEAAGREQDIGVEPEVGELLDQAVVALGNTGERGLDALLADLPGSGARALLEQAGDVGAFGPGARTLGDPAPQPRRETGERSGVANRAGGPD